MHSGHGFAYDTMRRAEVYSRHHHNLEAAAAGQDSLSLQHSLASSNIDHQVMKNLDLRNIFVPRIEFPTKIYSKIHISFSNFYKFDAKYVLEDCLEVM